MQKMTTARMAKMANVSIFDLLEASDLSRPRLYKVFDDNPERFREIMEETVKRKADFMKFNALKIMLERQPKNFTLSEKKPELSAFGASAISIARKQYKTHGDLIFNCQDIALLGYSLECAWMIISCLELLEIVKFMEIDVKDTVCFTEFGLGVISKR